MGSKEAFDADRPYSRPEPPHYVLAAYERWLHPSFSEQFPRMLEGELAALRGEEMTRRELVARARGVLDGVIELARSPLSGVGSEGQPAASLTRAAGFAIRGRVESVADQLDLHEGGDDLQRESILAMAYFVSAVRLRPPDGAEDTQVVREEGLLAEEHLATAAEKLARAMVSPLSSQT